MKQQAHNTGCSDMLRPQDDTILISIITVVLNDLPGIKRTLKSVTDQTYNKIEYIVIDGGSTDGTYEYILKHKDHIQYHISEADDGIYDAINKGLDVCTGELINILNAGDWLEPTALQTVVDNYKSERFDFFGGAAVVHDAQLNPLSTWYPSSFHTGSILTHIPLNHQAVFASKALYRSTGHYDTNHKLAADRKWMQRMYLNEHKIALSNDVISHFCLGGSSSNVEKSLQDISSVIVEFFPCLEPEEARELYTLLDEGFWIHDPGGVRFDRIGYYLSKYQNEHSLVFAMSQAMEQEMKVFISVLLSYKSTLAEYENESFRFLLKRLLKRFILGVKHRTENTFLYKPLKKMYLFVKNRIIRR